MPAASCWKCDGDHLAFHCRKWPGALHPPDRIPPHKRLQLQRAVPEKVINVPAQIEPAGTTTAEADITAAALVIVADPTAAIPARYAPTIDNARLPANYEQAIAMLAEVERVDQCREWANQFESLASYARMARDPKSEASWQRLKLWAIRRIGEILRQIPAETAGRPKKLVTAPSPISPTRRQASRDAGVSVRQRRQAEGIARVPRRQFQEAVDREKPPSVEELARDGAQPNNRRSRESPLIQLLERFGKEGQAIDLGTEFDTLDEAGKERARQAMSVVEAWVGRASLLIRGGW